MIVHPDFLDHSKLAHLRELAGERHAPTEWLLRLWGYCQLQRACEFELSKVGGVALSRICRAAPVEGEKLLEMLTAAGWVRVDGSKLIVHDWEFHNRLLVSAWKNGRKGGNPALNTARGPDTRAGAGRLSGGNAADNPSRARKEKTRQETRVAVASPRGTENQARKLKLVDPPDPSQNAVPGSKQEIHKKFAGLCHSISEKLRNPSET